jgi:hypothetical protein
LFFSVTFRAELKSRCPEKIRTPASSARGQIGLLVRNRDIEATVIVPGKSATGAGQRRTNP